MIDNHDVIAGIKRFQTTPHSQCIILGVQQSCNPSHGRRTRVEVYQTDEAWVLHLEVSAAGILEKEAASPAKPVKSALY